MFILTVIVCLKFYSIFSNISPREIPWKFLNFPKNYLIAMVLFFLFSQGKTRKITPWQIWSSHTDWLESPLPCSASLCLHPRVLSRFCCFLRTLSSSQQSPCNNVTHGAGYSIFLICIYNIYVFVIRFMLMNLFVSK